MDTEWLSYTARATELRARRHAALGDPTRLHIVEALVLGDLAPDQLARELQVGTNLLAHHLDVLEEAGLLARTRSHGDGRRKYLQLVPGALDDLLTIPRLRARSVLFVCTANSARSQLAAALWRASSPVPATSAGHRPARSVHPLALEVAHARELDLGDTRPRSYAEVEGQPDLVVSVCDLAREARVPFVAPSLHWSIADPVEHGDRRAFEATLDALEPRVATLAATVEAA